MLLREIYEKIDTNEIDLVDDLHYFMENDPGFYRRVMYPVISKMKIKIKAGEKCDNNIFRPCVDAATNIYCKKFNITDNEKSIFTDVDRDALAHKIFHQENEKITQGVYDKAE